MSDSNSVVQRRTPKPSVQEEPITPVATSAQHETNLLSSTERGAGSNAASILSRIEGDIEKEFVREEIALAHFWARLNGAGRRKVPVLRSIKNCFLSSWLNVLLVCVPAAWALNIIEGRKGPDAVISNTHHIITWALSFLGLIPLEQVFDWGGEQMCLYLGKDLGDLLTVTLNNAVEATLAIVLLAHCELRLLQATIIGVILLHLLLVPGFSFLVGGARIWSQDLHPHNTELNHSLLTLGCMTLIVPTAYFAALDRGGAAPGSAESIVNDTTRGQLLVMSRGISVILLIVYVGSRIFLADPPGENNAFTVHPDAPEAFKEEEKHLEEEEALTGPWTCIIMLLIAVGIMAYTAEALVENVEFVRAPGGIGEEWFGMFLLPMVSFAADGAIAIGFFMHSAWRLLRGKPVPTSTIAKGRSIDLSIQFILWWMPFMVVLGWWIGKPMTLLFDLFEVAVLVAACFLVNYVTQDAKTNWCEGLIMLSFYIMIVLCAWYYPGQQEVGDMNACLESVATFIAGGGEATNGE
ncbi:hypothetical protein FIBSPDRAFT_835491 [Athelia psychrophila]|uniref:Sodium/calcium exchanger membrane region domain-containing protein n=1 Tax=Athelia psychrophila TaxID=1759441 RepID=A0A166BWI7_9AGAM|nr:hypothetical protein FIBSPDRAFT_835491 [Fibularhizoctonia sp. CBS 109695]